MMFMEIKTLFHIVVNHLNKSERETGKIKNLKIIKWEEYFDNLMEYFKNW